MRSLNSNTSEGTESHDPDTHRKVSDWRILELMKEGTMRANLVIMRNAKNWNEITGSERR